MQINYMPYSYSKANFCGVERFEATNINKIGYLCHDTFFFREPRTDAFIQKYVLDNFKDDQKINIVSAGCSTGEEVYTQAMLYSELGNKVKIHAFDVSAGAIEEAKAGIYTMKRDSSSGRLSMFNEDNSYLIRDNNFIINKREQEYKKLFDASFNRTKDEFGRQKFEATDKIKKMCEFQTGDLKELSKMYDKNSVNVLNCRNVLYHLIMAKTRILHLPTWVKNEAEIIDDFARQAHQILKPNGLLVFGEKEADQGVDKKMIYSIMLDNGFVPIESNSDKEKIWGAKDKYNVNIWKKQA